MRLLNSYYLLLIIPFFLIIIFKFRKGENILRFSLYKLYKSNNTIGISRYFLRTLSALLLITAICAPAFYSEREVFYGEGIDIMLVLDTSTSMKAEDFKPNRLEAAKKVIEEFVDNRRNDRIGLTMFAGTSINRVPFTLDYTLLKEFMDDITFNMLTDGTAIGTALATAVARFEKSDAKSKVVILLTDGVNNAGLVSPEAAADTALKMGIKIYSVGVGSDGMAYATIQTPFGARRAQIPTEIDEKLLKEISEKTGGKYYRAKDEKALEYIYEEISELEKTKIESQIFSNTKHYYMNFLYGFLLLVFIEFVVYDLLLKRLP